MTREMRQPSKKPPPTMAAKAVIMVVVVENTGWYDSGSGKTKRTLKVLKISVKLTNMHKSVRRNETKCKRYQMPLTNDYSHY